MTTTFLQFIQAPVTWFALIWGAVIGSFLNVCIFRIPEGTFWAKTRSVCRACGSAIPAWHNIPLLSFVLLRGRASCCGAKLSVQYPLVEFLTAIMFVVAYWKFPFVGSLGGGAIAFDPNDALRAGHAAIFIALMIVCSVIDMRHMIIPDVISIPMIVATPAIVYLHPDLDWQSALIGVVLGGGSLYAIAWFYWLLRREVGMGMGDVKLLAAIGGWLGYQAILPTVLFGSVTGAVFGLASMVYFRIRKKADGPTMGMKTALPFGPFLALGAILHLLWGQVFREWLLL